MALEANEAERIYVEILLGIPRSESLVRMRPEVERFWDGLVVQIEQMRADGKGFMIPNEFPDVLPTKETEVRFNPQQPRAPDGKWTSGGGGAAAGDTGGDTPSGGGSSDDDEDEMYPSDDDFGYDTDAIGGEEYAEDGQFVLEYQQSEYIESLEDEQRQAMFVYTGNGHKNINKSLRGAPPPPIEETPGIDLDEVDLFAETVSDVVAGAPPLKQSITVFRGADARAVGLGDGVDARDLIGAEFVDKGIISTSLQEEIAYNFAGGRTNTAVIKMTVPAGQRALSLKRLSGEAEFEVALPPNTRFRITNIDDRGMIPIVNVEVVS